MVRGDPQTRHSALPGEAATGIDRDDLPHRRRIAGLTDPRAAADDERAAADARDARDGSRPLGPAVRVAHDLPDALRRRGDVDRDVEVSHMLYDTSRAPARM